MAITDVLRSRLDKAYNYAGSFAWGPLVQFSRTTILSLLKRVDVGQVRVVDTNGEVILCGNPAAAAGEPITELHIHSDSFWVRMLLFTDMGFAESYMLGEFSCPDLTQFFELFILNKDVLSNGTTLTSYASSWINGFARRTNTLANTRLNISAHYDISNDMFAAFLSPDMTYSCPIWLPTSDPDSLNESLQEAQERKLNRFIDATHIKSTDHVLEIGTGWGSFSIAAVLRTGCRVTSVTLSTEQKELAEDRIRAAGVADRITVVLSDYRKLEGQHVYDKVVSIEMLEAVGREFLPTYFGVIDRLLKKNTGIAAFQCITIPETRYESYHASTDFIRHYIFPGGHLPSITALTNAINTGSKNQLILHDIQNIGPHYAKTLRHWRINFLKHFDMKIRPALIREHVMEDGSQMSKKDVEIFKRKWEYYFRYCEAGFRTNTLGDAIFVVAREGAPEMLEQVPF